MLLLPEPAAFGEDVLLLAERVVVGEEPLPLGAPGRGGVKMRSLPGKTKLHSLSPDPPATLESCANPTEGGSVRKTEYTFFCKAKRREIAYNMPFEKNQRTKKVSPTIQEKLVEPEEMLVARLRSKMAPTHCELPFEIWPRFMSVAFIGHALPPKESVT